MKTLKLQVGKTYRNRKGEEVRIVENNNKGIYPCRGDNGEWYAENGRYFYHLEETPRDLIEEVTIPDVNQNHNENENTKA